MNEDETDPPLYYGLIPIAGSEEDCAATAAPMPGARHQGGDQDAPDHDTPGGGAFGIDFAEATRKREGNRRKRAAAAALEREEAEWAARNRRNVELGDLIRSLPSEEIEARANRLLAAMALRVWEQGRLVPCPEHRIPNIQDLTPEDFTREDYGRLTRACLAYDMKFREAGDAIGTFLSSTSNDRTTLFAGMFYACQEYWVETGRAPHFFEGFNATLRNWQARPIPVKMDRPPSGRAGRGVMSASLVRRGYIETLPDFGPRQVQDECGPILGDYARLPVPIDHETTPPLMLALLDAGTKPQRGRGAPIRDRLFVEALMAVPRLEREERVKFSTDVRGILPWLGWEVKDYAPNDPNKGGALFRGLLKAANTVIPGATPFKPLHAFTDLTNLETPSLDHKIGFVLEYPSGSHVGPGVDRAMLRRLGKESAAAWRLYLWLCFDWDRYGAKNGKPVLPFEPDVVRGADGVVLDAHGAVLTDRADRPVRNWRDRRAARTGKRIPNPARDCYPAYEPDDLARMCSQLSESSARARSGRRNRAVEAVERIKAVGGCVVEKTGRKTPSNPQQFPWRIMPPDHYPTPSAV